MPKKVQPMRPTEINNGGTCVERVGNPKIKVVLGIAYQSDIYKGVTIQFHW